MKTLSITGILFRFKIPAACKRGVLVSAFALYIIKQMLHLMLFFVGRYEKIFALDFRQPSVYGLRQFLRSMANIVPIGPCTQPANNKYAYTTK